MQIFFPTGADAIPAVTVEAKPGWKFTITKQHLAKPITTDDGTINEVVSAIDWKATTPAAAIRPDEFGAFTINADGISAHATQLVFRAIQTYSNGTVVRWVDPVTAGGPAAEHPTPILQLTAPEQSGGSVTTTTGAPGSGGTTIISTTKDNNARALAIVAMVLGAVALVAATAALIKKRRA